MRSQFFGNRILDMRNADPFHTRAFMCPEISQEELDKLKGFESGSKAKDDELAKLKADLEKATKKPDPANDPDLADKARKEREEKEKSGKHEKSLTSAIEFTHASKNFLKDNAGLIPKTVEGVFAMAEKENFGSAIEKANAIKVGVVQEFFAVQANHDLLTSSQKVELADFLALTKNVKQERVESVYAMIFEPTLETARKLEKAKQVNNGSKDQSDAEKALADRMQKQSRKHYLGEKA